MTPTQQYDKLKDAITYLVYGYGIMFIAIVIAMLMINRVHTEQRHVLIQRCHARAKLFDINYKFWGEFGDELRNPQLKALLKEHVKELTDTAKEDCNTP